MDGLATRQTFLFEEFKALRSEIDHHLKAVIQLELAAIAGIAAVYSFVYSPTTHPEGNNVLWAMPVIVLLTAIVALPHYIRVQTIGAYIRTLEIELANPGAWQAYLADLTKQTNLKGVQGYPFVLFVGIAWLSVFAASIWLAL